jgi:hypothetical protein
VTFFSLYRITIAVSVVLVGCNGRFRFDPGRARPPVADGAGPAEDGPDGPSPDMAPPPDGAVNRSPPADAALDQRPDLAPIVAPRDAAPLADRSSSDRSSPDLPPTGPTVCGNGDPSCICSGTQCSCGLEKDCTFAGMGCERVGGSCTLLCHNRNRCTGECLHSCRLQCYGGSVCELTMGDHAEAEVEGAGGVGTLVVGPSSHVKCESGAVCSITCTGACSLECESARCNLKCAGDTGPHQADQGGSCN